MRSSYLRIPLRRLAPLIGWALHNLAARHSLGKRQTRQQHEGLDVGVESEYRSFYRDLLGKDTDGLRGHALVQYIDDEPSAATLAISSAGGYYSLQIAHDERFKQFSPGTLLEAVEMQWFFGNPSLNRYEFLGGAGPNKRRWTSTATDTCTVAIRRRGLHLAIADPLLRRIPRH